MTLQISSTNFEFLRERDVNLVMFAAWAERYVFEDPNTSLLKIRQFAELLARQVAARNGFDPRGEDFRNVLNLLQRHDLIPRHVHELFDILRLRGNQAAHEGEGDRQAALCALLTAHQLAVWFQRAFFDKEFKGLAFRPLPTPANADGELREQLKKLRAEAAIQEEALRNASALLTSAQDSQKTTESHLYFARAEAGKIEAERNEMRQMLERLEADYKAEREGYLSALAKATKIEQQTIPDALNSFVERSKLAARRLGSAVTDAVPLAQIRFVSQRRCNCRGERTLVQVAKGGMVKWSCSGCQELQNLSYHEWADLDLWIACPTCRTRTEAQKVRSNFGYQCRKCGWNCFLAHLLPWIADL